MCAKMCGYYSALGWKISNGGDRSVARHGTVLVAQVGLWRGTAKFRWPTKECSASRPNFGGRDWYVARHGTKMGLWRGSVKFRWQRLECSASWYSFGGPDGTVARYNHI